MPKGSYWIIFGKANPDGPIKLQPVLTDCQDDGDVEHFLDGNFPDWADRYWVLRQEQFHAQDEKLDKEDSEGM